MKKRLFLIFGLLLLSACKDSAKPEYDPAEVNLINRESIWPGRMEITVDLPKRMNVDELYLFGVFSDWETNEKCRFEKGEDGVFRLDFEFEIGNTYYFKFVADGVTNSAYDYDAYLSPQATYYTIPTQIDGTIAGTPYGVWKVVGTYQKYFD